MEKKRIRRNNSKLVLMKPDEFNATDYISAVMAVPCRIWENERLMFGVAHMHEEFYGDELAFQPFFYYATPALLQDEIDGVLNVVSERGNRKIGIVPLMNCELYTQKVYEKVVKALNSYMRRDGDEKFDEVCLCMPDPDDKLLD